MDTKMAIVISIPRKPAPASSLANAQKPSRRLGKWFSKAEKSGESIGNSRYWCGNSPYFSIVFPLPVKEL